MMCTMSTRVRWLPSILWISRMVYRTSVCIATSWRARRPPCLPMYRWTVCIRITSTKTVCWSLILNCWIESSTSWKARTMIYSRSSVMCTCWSDSLSYPGNEKKNLVFNIDKAFEHEFTSNNLIKSDLLVERISMEKEVLGMCACETSAWEGVEGNQEYLWSVCWNGNSSFSARYLVRKAIPRLWIHQLEESEAQFVKDYLARGRAISRRYLDI